ncbi:MAG: hypothetical protein LBK77_09600, partial [Spirochaetaceae bacterium]|nr:hypothetical protein [Spirochaetaceae bacterium]
PLSGPDKKTARRTLPYTLAEDGALVIYGKEYRRPFTGEGGVYGGTMVRGATRLNIRLSLGGFKDGAAADTSYLYISQGIPIPLKGDLAGGVLELAEDGGLFSFPRFDPASGTAAGFWLGGGKLYEVTLAVEALEGLWRIETEDESTYEFDGLTLSPDGSYEWIFYYSFQPGGGMGGGWEGERGTYTVTGAEITFQPERAGSAGTRLIGFDDPESWKDLSARDRTRMRTTIRYVLLGDTLTLTGRRTDEDGSVSRLNGRTYTKYRETEGEDGEI